MFVYRLSHALGRLYGLASPVNDNAKIQNSAQSSQYSRKNRPNLG